MKIDQVDKSSILFSAREVCLSHEDEILGLLGLDTSQRYKISCRCPIHNGDNPTGFSYCRQKKIWACWTRHCEEEYGNDLIGLVAGINNISILDAAKWIMKVTGQEANKIDLVDIDRKNFVRSRINLEPDKYKIFDREILQKIDSNVPYFLSRGLSATSLKSFSAFFCEKPKNRLYNRACFPIFDIENHMVGFCGRSVNGQTPKWLFHPYNIPISKTFFGIDHAKECIKITKTVILVEGQLDVVKMHEIGVTNTVGIFGVNLSDHQIKALLKLGVLFVILCLDPDKAGEKGVSKIEAKCSSYFKTFDLTSKLKNDPSKLASEDLNALKNEIVAISEKLKKYAV